MNRHRVFATSPRLYGQAEGRHMTSILQRTTTYTKTYLRPKKVLHAITRRLETHLLTFIDLWFDTRYNITTRSDNFEPAFEDDGGYDPMSYSGLKRILKKVPIVPGEVLADIGCGRGRVVCVFGRQRGVAQCLGVEYHSGHAETARQNAVNLRGRQASIRILEGDAAKQNYDDVTLAFLFNPFGAATMRRTIRQIEISLERHPRSLRLVYVNPKHETVLEEQPWLVKIDTFHIPYRVFQSLRTSLWRSIEVHAQ
jgi:SAM-dependent methyltransferase